MQVLFEIENCGNISDLKNLVRIILGKQQSTEEKKRIYWEYYIFLLWLWAEKKFWKTNVRFEFSKKFYYIIEIAHLYTVKVSMTLPKYWNVGIQAATQKFAQLLLCGQIN